MKEIIEELKQYEARSMHDHQLPVVWDKAKDEYVWDINGSMYIDFTSCIFLANCGHSFVAKAIIEQAEKGLLHSYTFPNKERLILSKKLVNLAPRFCDRVFLLSSGTEATECAVKLMRLQVPHKKIIVSFKGAMHGKTMLAEQLKGDFTWADHTDNVFHLPFPSEESMFDDDIAKFDTEHVAGFIIESYRGWDARFMPVKYVRNLCKWAEEHRVPVCFDEIQGGFGRTGKMFAFEHYGVTPDLICVGKGLGGGLPISAVIGRKKFLNLPDDLTSTHSANPLCCAAAIASVDEISKLLPDTLTKGILLEHQLLALKHKYFRLIKEINRTGLLAGVICDSTETASQLCEEAAERGLLLVKTGRESVKIGPPLCISQENIKRGVEIMDACLREIYEQRNAREAFQGV